MLQIPKKAYEALRGGASASDMVRDQILTSAGLPVSPRQAERWKKAYREGSAELGEDYEVAQDDLDVSKVVSLLRDKPMTRREISNKLDRSETSVQSLVQYMLNKGYNVFIEKQKISIPTTSSSLMVDKVVNPIVDSMKFTCAFPSDIHCGSKEEQITNLAKFIATAREMGVKNFLFAGDMFTGINMYRGHNMDVYTRTAEGQEEAVDRAIQPLDDEEWYVLGGNHDFSWLKSSSIDLVWRFCQKYPNVHYLGYDEEDVPLTDKFAIRLWHPTGGLPYATSYRLQKGMETLAFEQLLESIDNPRVKVLIAGHLHVALEMPQGGIFGIQAGCFEGRTSLLKRLGKYPRVGAYITTFHWEDSGDLSRIDSRWFQYKEIKNDYKNYQQLDDMKEAEELEYIYRLDGEPATADA